MILLLLVLVLSLDLAEVVVQFPSMHWNRHCRWSSGGVGDACCCCCCESYVIYGHVSVVSFHYLFHFQVAVVLVKRTCSNCSFRREHYKAHDRIVIKSEYLLFSPCTFRPSVCQAVYRFVLFCFFFRKLYFDFTRIRKVYTHSRKSKTT